MRTALTTLLLALLLAPARGEETHPLDRAAKVLACVAPAVEKACGAGFARPPRIAELTEEAARAVFRVDLAPEVERRYPTACEGQRETLLRTLAAASVRSCVARYSPSQRAIVLVRPSFDAQAAALGVAPEEAEHLLAATLAHECVHALDDERFGLVAAGKRAPDAEARRALAMVVEGRAVFFGRVAAKELHVPQRLREVLPGGAEPTGYHELFLRLTYRLGGEFVARLVARGGISLADRALRKPPATTHLVCHPDRWPDGQTDGRPASLLTSLFPETPPEVLSELELRARYAALDGETAAAALFAGFRGGAKRLVAATNLSVLAFADAAAAERFRARSAQDVPSARKGALVVRAASRDEEAARALLARAVAALGDGAETGR